MLYTPYAFLQSGSGAVLRSLQSKLRDVVSVKDFGAVGDGVTDDTDAIVAAVSTTTGDIALYFPRGRYLLGPGATLEFVDRNVTIYGDGQMVSQILCSHADARVVFSDTVNTSDARNVKRLNLRDITFTKTAATTAGNGGVCIDATWAYTGNASGEHVSFENVTIQGTSGRYWDEGVRLTDAGGCRFSNLRIDNQNNTSSNSKAAIVVERSAASNVTGFLFGNIFLHGFTAGVRLEHNSASQNGTIEGIYFESTEISSCRYAIFDDNVSSSHKQINGVHFIGSHVGVSRALFNGYWLSNFFVMGNSCTLSDTADSAGGGEPFINVTNHLEVAEIAGNRFFRSTSNTTSDNCIEIPGGDEASKLKVYANVFENWDAPIALASGSMSRTMAAAWIGPNTLISAGSYPAIGIIHDWENGPYQIDLDHANNLMQFRGPTSGFTFGGRVRPESNDQAALGAAMFAWSDLFLASGGVINWGNGEVTLTETDANTLTLAGGTLVLPASGLQIGSSNPFSDSAGTLTLQNVDALDATTEATIESAIDTLANLTSIQGVGFTFGAYAATLLNNANEAAFKAATNLEANTDYYAPGGTDVATADGGTGASTAQGACANLRTWYVLAASGVRVAHTGSASETTLATITVPPNAMGANGRVRVKAVFGFADDGDTTGTWTPRVRFNGVSGTIYAGPTLANTTTAYVLEVDISNRNATNSQVGPSNSSTGGWGQNSNPIITSAVDTTAAVDVVISGQLADSGDTMRLESYTVELLYQA